MRRDELKLFLQENGVQTQIHYPKPLNQLNIFKNAGKRPVADKMSEQLLSLPIYAELTQEQIDYIVKLIKKFSYKN